MKQMTWEKIFSGTILAGQRDVIGEIWRAYLDVMKGSWRRKHLSKGYRATLKAVLWYTRDIYHELAARPMIEDGEIRAASSYFGWTINSRLYFGSVHIESRPDGILYDKRLRKYLTVMFDHTKKWEPFIYPGGINSIQLWMGIWEQKDIGLMLGHANADNGMLDLEWYHVGGGLYQADYKIGDGCEWDKLSDRVMRECWRKVGDYKRQTNELKAPVKQKDRRKCTVM